MRLTDIDVTSLQGANVLLDIDGTLVADGMDTVSIETAAWVQALALRTRVFLASNGPVARTSRLAAELGVTALPRLAKPFGASRVVLPSEQTRIVIGDRQLTDGLFARRIGATFVRVDSLRAPSDTLAARVRYAVDRPLSLFFSLLLLMRPQHWLKNMLVFAPAFFAGTALSGGVVASLGIAFISFSLAASGIYALNDLLDLEEDAKHPRKRLRPLPSGSMSPWTAGIFGVSLITLAGITAFLLSLPLLVVLGVYMAINAGYSFFGKRVAILDVLLVAACYVLRILAGGVVAYVTLSPWILVATFFLALFLVLGKRKGESLQSSSRKVLETYTPRLLDGLLLASAICAVAAYTLWSLFAHPSNLVVYSVIPVIAVMARVIYLLYTKPEAAETPETLFFRDRWIFGATLFWILGMWLLFYGTTTS